MYLLRPFKLKQDTGSLYIGMSHNKPVMVPKIHGLFFDIRTKPDHTSTLCTVEHCLFHDKILQFSSKHSTEFFVVYNDDDTYTFRTKNNCLSEKNGKLFIGTCNAYNDKFKKIPIEKELDTVDKDEYKKGEDGVIFNYGEENTSHVVDNVVNMKKEDMNYTLVPVERKHNSHVHRVGGFANRAFYTYYSYHPSSRHSTYNYHGRHHGVPKSWAKNGMLNTAKL